MQQLVVAAALLALLALLLAAVAWFPACNARVEPYSPADELPQLPSGSGFPWVSNKKWVAYYYGVYRARVSGTPLPAWPNPTDRLLSNTQKAALDPVHAFKLRQINELERRCVSRRCVASETAARVSAIWAARYPRDAVLKMYADVDAYLLPATLPSV
jgi:hypothetical protein